MHIGSSLHPLSRQASDSKTALSGICYQNGMGCEQSYERAAGWFEKAIEQGDAPAMYALGDLYREGKGVPQSCERAFELYRESAAQGHPVSNPGTSSISNTQFTHFIFVLLSY